METEARDELKRIVVEMMKQDARVPEYRKVKRWVFEPNHKFANASLVGHWPDSLYGKPAVYALKRHLRLGGQKMPAKDDIKHLVISALRKGDLGIAVNISYKGALIATGCFVVEFSRYPFIDYRFSDCIIQAAK